MTSNILLARAVNTITFTGLSALVTNSQVTSTAYDNSANLYPRNKLQVSIGSPASGTSATGYIQFWVLISADTSTTYPSPYTNGILVGVLDVVANSTTYNATWDLPDDIVNCEFVANNQSGGTLTAATVKVEGTYRTAS